MVELNIAIRPRILGIPSIGIENPIGGGCGNTIKFTTVIITVLNIIGNAIINNISADKISLVTLFLSKTNFFLLLITIIPRYDANIAIRLYIGPVIN